MDVVWKESLKLGAGKQDGSWHTRSTGSERSELGTLKEGVADSIAASGTTNTSMASVELSDRDVRMYRSVVVL